MKDKMSNKRLNLFSESACILTALYKINTLQPTAQIHVKTPGKNGINQNIMKIQKKSRKITIFHTQCAPKYELR